MRIVRALIQGKECFGLVKDTRMIALKGNPFAAIEETGESFTLADVQLLAPVMPGKIVAVGVNYLDHMQEMKHEKPVDPILFIKPSTCVIGPEEPIIMPPESERVDYECELCAVIAKRCRCVAEEEAMDYVFGFTCLNDVTARDLQQRDGQWTRSKGFDTFAPIGPWIETEMAHYQSADIETRLNGQVKQRSNTRMQITPVARLIAYISRVMTLLPGDCIATGTPAGIGPMQPGDIVEVEISGLGVLRNPVLRQ